MYKGIVIEKDKNKIIVNCKQKGFVAIKMKKGVEVGDQIYFFKKDIYVNNRRKRSSLLIATFVFILLCFDMLKLDGIIEWINPDVNQNKYSYAALVSIDINPSLELELDSDMHVQDVRYVNKEAEGLINKKMLIGKFYTLAVKDIIVKAQEQGYIKGKMNEELVMISAVNTIKNKNANDIEYQIKELFKDEKNLNLVIVSSDDKKLNESRNETISLGKYSVLSESNEKDTIEVDKIKDMDVKDLVDKGIVNNDNSKIIEPVKVDKDNTHKNEDSSNNFVIDQGNEYFDTDTLISMGFKVDVFDKSTVISRNNKEFKMTSKEHRLNINNKNYFLLKETLEYFNIDYKYDGSNIEIFDGKNMISLFYGNPVGKFDMGKVENSNIIIETPITKENIVENKIVIDNSKTVKNNDIEFIDCDILIAKGFDVHVVYENVYIKYNSEEIVLSTKNMYYENGKQYISYKDIINGFNKIGITLDANKMIDK